MKLKKLLASILCVAMVLSTMGTVAFADATVATVNGVGYTSLAEALTAAGDVDGKVTIELTADVEWETGAGHGSTPFVPEESKAIVTINGNDNTITATGDGVGPIRAANDTLLTFNNVNFVDESESYAEDSWEFTYLEFAGKLKFVNCDFKDEIQLDSESADFENCTFESNEEDVYAVWVGNGAVTFTNNCYFTGYRGLKMHEDYGSDIVSATIKDCKFENITKKPGIAIGDLNNSTSVGISDCEFINVQAGEQGSYILETDTDVSIFTFESEENKVVNGSITPGYTDDTSVWGEGRANAKDSFVVELYAGDEKIAQTSLNDYEDIIDGDVDVTWNVNFKGEDSEYWTVDWYGNNPSVDTVPTKVVLVVDGVVVAENDVQMNAPDNLNKVEWDELEAIPAAAKIGNKRFATIQAAIDAAEADDTITLLAGEYNGFNVPTKLNNVTFVGETDADGNNLVTIKTLEDGIESHNGGIFVQAETTTFKNLNFTAGTVKGARSDWMSSSLGNTNGDTGMGSSLKNLTVENCNFVGSGVQYAIWTNQGNVTVKNSTITNYDTAVDSYRIRADQKMVIENTEIADVRNAFHTGEAEVGSQIVVTETTIDSDVIDLGGAAAVTITNSEISNAVITTYTDNNQMTISDTLFINSVISESAKGTYNGVNIAEDYDAAVAAVAANNEIISTKLNISFRQVETGLYDIVLNGEDDIYEFVGAELTFDNDSLTAGNEYMNYEILGIGGKTNAEKSIEKADTYALRLVDGAERMSGRDLVIGQVKFYGQGDITFTVSEGKVVTTEYGTNLGQYYTVDTDDTTPDTLVVNGITNGAVEEVTRDVVVNVAYNHALVETYWSDNQITVTLKDGFGNIYGPFDVSDKIETIPNVKLGRLTVTLEAPGFRKYVYNTTLEAGADENDALVLNFWNEVKRDTVQSPLAEIEAGKGFTNKNFLVGDIVMDYTVDEYDLAAVTSYYGMYELTDADKYIKYDLNRDGNIDIIDVHYVLHTLNN